MSRVKNLRRSVENLLPRKCAWCGKEFEPHSPNQKYCSYHCSRIVRRSRPPGLYELREENDQLQAALMKIARSTEKNAAKMRQIARDALGVM